MNTERVSYLLDKTDKHRLSAKKSTLSIDDTLLEHVGNLFEYIDKHYNHSNHSYSLAHNLVTSHYVSGAVRFPVDWYLYRRYEECTQWEEYVEKHFPDKIIPKKKNERNKFKKEVEPTLLEDFGFLALHHQLQVNVFRAMSRAKLR